MHSRRIAARVTRWRGGDELFAKYRPKCESLDYNSMKLAMGRVEWRYQMGVSSIMARQRNMPRRSA